jgi:hypothetical protein
MAHARIKTVPTGASPAAYLAAIDDETRRSDCRALSKLMSAATGERPRMWGTSIVGFGTKRYKYASGREGESCTVGFSPRKGDITLYFMGGLAGFEKLLARLGRHKNTRGCLYIRRLEDVDLNVLETIIAQSFSDTMKG